jgi:hypothetical protein
LGAIVAPLVFTMIPRPEAATAMTMIFQRFDVVAVACSVVVLGTEAWRAPGQTRVRRLDVARMLTGVLGAGLVLLEALWLTPAIVGLHLGGAIRGLGPAGLELERMHRLAEACGKAQVAVVVVLIALEVATLTTPAPPPAPESPRKGDAAAAQAGDRVSPGEATHGA